MEIGFIGLGSMGRPMAARLLSAGHRLRVWNRSPGPARELAGQGAEAVGGAAEAFRGDVAVTMLADDAAYRSVGLAGPLLDQAPRGMVHLNMATVSIELTRELAAAHAERGLVYAAAPVFGRGDVAAAGKLTIVASGPEAALDRAAPLFDAMGQRTWRLGPDPSQAAAAKIAGNFMIASVIETIGEATTLAARHGVPPEMLLEVLTSSLFNAPVYKNYGAIIAGRKYQPAGFRLALGLKDVRLALAAGEGARVPLPFASVLRDAFLEAVAHGDADLDWAALADVARRRAGSEVGAGAAQPA
jgi:3-hydroxyisobutyrate dehydrogenase-like beta-hydroxyacid dehydrogenase